MASKRPLLSSPSFTQQPFSIRPPDKPIGAGGFGKLLHHRTLLEVSRQLLGHKFFGATVVIAQTSCEVFTEVAIATILKNKGLESLDQPISNLVRNFNLTNDKVRKLYVALSDDSIHQSSFWSAYVALVKLRNDIVHKGKQVTAKQANDSYKTALQLILHLERTLEAKYSRSKWIWKTS